jgi:CubicO group peptidase (beta-lactamase class C family)
VSVGAYLALITPFGFTGACLVGVGGEVVSNAGYGFAVRAEEFANTADTVFSVGSVTKQFTAAAILKLEEQGALTTNDPIQRFVGGVPADKAGITLHHLLTHTSGLCNYTGDDYEPAERDETVAKMLASPLLFPPGADYAYSNAGYSLLAAVVEIAAGEEYEGFLQRELFGAAGLEMTGYRLPDWSGRVVAHWYAGDVDNGTPLEKPYPSWNLLGNGDMLSTTEDMFRWHRGLLDDTVLSGESRRKLFTPYVGDYAYGWRVVSGDRGLVVEHGGASTYGSSCAFKRFLDEDAVVVLFCNATYGASPLAMVVEDRVVAAAFGEEVPLPPAVARAGLGDGVAGLYALPSGGRLRVRPGVVEAEGQDAVDELAFGGSSQAALNDRALRVVSSLRAGDDEPLRREVAGDEQRVERYRRVLGALDGSVSVAGTMPSHLRGVLVTHLRAGDEGIGFYWQDGALLGLGEVERDPVYAVALAPADGGYVAYDLRAERAVGVEFDDCVLTLTPDGGAPVHAERV